MPLTRVQWAEQNYEAAVSASAGSGIFPMTLIAQAVMESQGQINGTYYPAQSQLAKYYNNYFGIKGTGTAGSVVLPTEEYINGHYVTINATFAKYHNVYDSFRAYINFLSDNPRYASKGVFTAQNYQEQLTRIASAGYATNPNYAATLINIANNLIDDLADEIEQFGTGLKNSIALPLFLGLTAVYLITKKNGFKN